MGMGNEIEVEPELINVPTALTVDMCLTRVSYGVLTILMTLMPDPSFHILTQF